RRPGLLQASWQAEDCDESRLSLLAEFLPAPYCSVGVDRSKSEHLLSPCRAWIGKLSLILARISVLASWPAREDWSSFKVHRSVRRALGVAAIVDHAVAYAPSVEKAATPP